MKLLKLIFCVILLLPLLASAQDSLTLPKKEYGFEIGANHLGLYEEFMFPSNFTGLGGNLNLFYSKAKSSSRQHLSMQTNFSKASDYLDFEALSTHLRLSYVYGFRFRPLTDSNKAWFVGPSVFFNPNVNYFLQTDDSHLYWLTQNGFGLNIWARYLLKNNKQLTFSMDIPVLIMESQTDYPFFYSNFNPYFTDVLQMLHRQPNVPFDGFLHSGQFSAYYDLFRIKKSLLSIGYNLYFANNQRNIFIVKNSFNLKISRTK